MLKPCIYKLEYLYAGKYYLHPIYYLKTSWHMLKRKDVENCWLMRLLIIGSYQKSPRNRVIFNWVMMSGVNLGRHRDGEYTSNVINRRWCYNYWEIHVHHNNCITKLWAPGSYFLCLYMVFLQHCFHPEQHCFLLEQTFSMLYKHFKLIETSPQLNLVYSYRTLVI